MKKSFKKAGAAVLSMAMLLSMGAISMPVFAEGETNPTNWPGQVKVIVDSANHWADDTDTNINRKFDYLSGVTDATVKMYRVATLGTNGWQWDSNLTSALNKVYAAPSTATEKLNDFEKLLHTTNGTDNRPHFDATSEELLQVASAIERVARDTNGGLTLIDSADLHITNGSGSVYLPKDELLNQTEDVIGYYLITTTTNDSGVVLQPVLITLKNSDNHDNPVTVALKGYQIDVKKTIEAVQDDDKERALGGTVIADSKNTAVVAKDDVITYKIETEVPKYDVNLNAATDEMLPFTITDTPSAGIKVTTAAGSVGSETYSPTNLKVMADLGTPNVTSDDVELKASEGDFTVSGTANGFTISIPASVYHTTGNSTGRKLEGQKLTITFDATVDDANFVTENYANATYSDLTAANINAQQSVVDSNTAYSTATESTTIGNAKTAAAALYDEYTAAGDVPEKVAIATYLAKGSAEDYTGVTKAQVEAKLDAAQALIDAHTTYTTASGKVATELAADSDNEKALKAVLNETSLEDVDKIKAILALDALKATPAGNDNTGSITYGNEYSTGKGNGNDQDKATVYSVDLDLTKVTETLKLDPRATTDEGYEASDKDTWYTKDTETEYVSGAVFELIKEDDSTSTAADKTPKSLGLAVSDSSGKLWLLTKGAETETKPQIATTVAANATVYYTTRTDTTVTPNKEYYTPYTVTAVTGDTNRAWNKLTIGNYTLKELYAPAGYKTVDDITFEIEAEQKNDASKDYTGVFSAQTSDTDGKVIKSENETKGATYFNGPKGALQANFVDPKADELPATGGIGTVLFTAGGISIVLIAGALFVMYMKKRNAEDEE